MQPSPRALLGFQQPVNGQQYLARTPQPPPPQFSGLCDLWVVGSQANGKEDGEESRKSPWFLVCTTEETTLNLYVHHPRSLSSSRLPHPQVLRLEVKMSSSWYPSLSSLCYPLSQRHTSPTFISASDSPFSGPPSERLQTSTWEVRGLQFNNLPAGGRPAASPYPARSSQPPAQSQLLRDAN